MSENIENIIKEIVESWMLLNKPFTAFNVTLEIQEHGIDIKHRAIRDVIHQTATDALNLNPLFNTYMSKWIGTGKRRALLYCPAGYDINDFEFNVKPFTPTTVALTINNRDSRGRVRIPTQFCRESNLTNKVNVEATLGSIEITHDIDGNYTVEPNGALRIAGQIFDTAFMYQPDMVNIETHPNVIRIFA